MRVSEDPHISAGVGPLATESSIPFIGPVMREEKPLAKTIVHREAQVNGFVSIQWIEIIIEPIAIGCKGRRHRDVAVVHHFDKSTGSVFATIAVAHLQQYFLRVSSYRRIIHLCRRILEHAAVAIAEGPIPANNI